MFTSRGVAFFVVFCCVATVTLFGTAAAQGAPPPEPALAQDTPAVAQAPASIEVDSTGVTEESEEETVRSLDNDVEDPETDVESAGTDGIEDPDITDEDTEVEDEDSVAQAPTEDPLSGERVSQSPAAAPEGPEDPRVEEDIRSSSMGLSVRMHNREFLCYVKELAVRFHI